MKKTTEIYSYVNSKYKYITFFDIIIFPITTELIALSAWAVEYTDCTFAVG